MLAAAHRQIPAGKVVCVGLNYRDHVKEMDGQVADEPVIFLKPSSALVPLEEPVAIPVEFGACHYEAEMSILIGEQLGDCTEEEAAKAIIGVGVALDLTLRDLQSQFKQKGHPWDKAKRFLTVHALRRPFVGSRSSGRFTEFRTAILLSTER